MSRLPRHCHRSTAGPTLFHSIQPQHCPYHLVSARIVLMASPFGTAIWRMVGSALLWHFAVSSHMLLDSAAITLSWAQSNFDPCGKCCYSALYDALKMWKLSALWIVVSDIRNRNTMQKNLTGVHVVSLALFTTSKQHTFDVCYPSLVWWFLDWGGGGGKQPPLNQIWVWKPQ